MGRGGGAAGRLAGELGVAHPEADGMRAAREVGGESGAPGAAADDGHVHGAPAVREPRRRSVPAAIRLRLARCFQMMRTASGVAAPAVSAGARSRNAATASAVAPVIEAREA